MLARPPVSTFNPADLFRHEAQFTHLAAGEALFKEGDAADFMYVLIKGTAEIFVRDYRVEEAHEGALIGEMAMIDHGLRSATVRARSDCQLVRIDQRRFDFLVTQTPFFARHVMQIMARRLRRTDTLLR